MCVGSTAVASSVYIFVVEMDNCSHLHLFYHLLCHSALEFVQQLCRSNDLKRIYECFEHFFIEWMMRYVTTYP